MVAARRPDDSFCKQTCPNANRVGRQAIFIVLGTCLDDNRALWVAKMMLWGAVVSSSAGNDRKASAHEAKQESC